MKTFFIFTYTQVEITRRALSIDNFIIYYIHSMWNKHNGDESNCERRLHIMKKKREEENFFSTTTGSNMSENNSKETKLMENFQIVHKSILFYSYCCSFPSSHSSLLPFLDFNFMHFKWIMAFRVSKTQISQHNFLIVEIFFYWILKITEIINKTYQASAKLFWDFPLPTNEAT